MINNTENNPKYYYTINKKIKLLNKINPRNWHYEKLWSTYILKNDSNTYFSKCSHMTDFIPFVIKFIEKEERKLQMIEHVKQQLKNKELENVST